MAAICPYCLKVVIDHYVIDVQHMISANRLQNRKIYCCPECGEVFAPYHVKDLFLPVDTYFKRKHQYRNAYMQRQINLKGDMWYDDPN